MSGAIGIQSTGAIVLTAEELTDDMLLVQVVTVGAPLSGVTLGSLKDYVTGQTGLYNEGGVLIVISATSWPLSSAGLLPGALWTTGPGGFAYVVAGHTPNPSAPAVLLSEISALGLLALGGGNLPLTDPHKYLQLWNNTGVINVSLG